MLVVPLLGPAWLACEVCRAGSARACCWPAPHVAFVCCSLCAQTIAAGVVVQIALRMVMRLPEHAPALLA